MTDKDEVLIDDYLRGKLSSEDKILFDKRMLDDSFRARFEEVKNLVQVLREEDGKKMKTILQKIEDNSYVAPDPKSRRDLWMWVVAILGFTVLSIIAYLYVQNPPTVEVNKDNIYAQFYEPYPNVVDPIVKGGIDSISIYQYYELKSYDEVIAQFEKKPTLLEDEQFYLACSYLEKGNLIKASELYQTFTESEKYKYPARWYIALICIKEKQSDCTLALNNVARDESNPYNKQAGKLFIKLKASQD